MSTETLEFKTELKQLLDLIIHSLYTKKEIFLRELISNAADAIDRLRFEALTKPELIQGDSNWKITLTPDEKAGTLTVSDNGIGMTRETIVENLGTIAKSGTRAFLENLQAVEAQQRPELIGQFGVGFYASFMVAERVTVVSRAAGADAAVKWESDGQGKYTVTEGERANRGTDVILHLREDAKEFLQPWRLKEIVHRYSEFLDHPIVLGEETLNSRQAIWLRNKNEIKPEEYAAFYKQISRDEQEPLKTIHIAAEGTTEFRALLFIPAAKPFDWMMGPPKKSGVDLFVRRVLIMHECEELAPTYLRFIRGVVDSADLPLNVSRETLQHNPLLGKIRGNLVNRVLKTLEEMKESEYETYLKFFSQFGENLKEGAAQDWNNRQRIADLLLFESTKTEAGKFTTLAKYVEGMPADQKEIYYLTGETRAQIENSPYVEAFKAKGQEVLLLTDPVDEYLMSALDRYKEKPLKAADRGESGETVDAATVEKFKPVLETLKKKLGDEVKDVRLSGRLKESAACLVADEGQMSAHLERLMARMGRAGEGKDDKRVLELNPNHPVVKALLAADENRVENWGRILLDEAVIAEGSRLADPAGFARRVNELIAAVAGAAAASDKV